jgi:hypothetical protein
MFFSHRIEMPPQRSRSSGKPCELPATSPKGVDYLISARSQIGQSLSICGPKQKTETAIVR